MKRLCILHANCQGEPLAFLLRSSPVFAEQYEVRRFVNYLREPLPADMLAACDVFLFQPLSDRWDELATSRLAGQLPQGVQSMHIPNMFFKGYWPFWTNKSPLDFGDSFLDTLFEQGLSLPEAMRIYVHGRLDTKFDLDAIAAESLAKEREKEQGALVDTANYVAAHWQERPLFTSVNHPAPELIIRVAEAVLERLGLPPLSEAAKAACPVCDDEFDLPVHPLVGRHFALPFVSAETTYPVYGKSLTFAQYAACYMDCRLQGMTNFIAYLHQISMD